MVEKKLLALVFFLTLVSFGVGDLNELIDAIFNGTSEYEKPEATNSNSGNGNCTCVHYYECNATATGDIATINIK